MSYQQEIVGGGYFLARPVGTSVQEAASWPDDNANYSDQSGSTK